MKLFISMFALIVAVATSAQSVKFTSLENGQIQAVGKGFSGSNSSYQVNFYRNSDFLNSINTNDNGSFSYTSPKSTFRTKQVLVVKVLNFLGSGRHYERSWEYRLGDPIDNEKVRNYARKQGQKVAYRIVNTFGLRENFKYNLVNGFSIGYQDLLRHNRRGDAGYRHYKEGYEQGKVKGFPRGVSAGKVDAKNKADEQGYVHANARFLSAVDKGEPDTTVVVPPVTYTGANLKTNVPSVYDHLSDQDYDFSRRARNLSWEHDGFRIRELGSNWSLRNVYDFDGDYRFQKNYFRAEYGLGEWKNNGLGGRFNRKLYRELSDTQKSLFEDIFRSVFEKVVEEEYLRARTRRNFRAHSMGEDFGFIIGQNVVFNRGVQEGFTAGANMSSMNSFIEVFPGFYTDAFNKRVDYLTVNPVLILNDYAFVGEAFPTGSIELIVKNIVNYGGASFKGAPLLKSLGLSQKKRNTIELDRLSSNQGEELRSQNTLTINSDFPLEQEQVISIELGNVTKRARFKITWNNVLKNAALNPNLSESQKQTLKAYVFNNVKSEWSSQKGLKNLYKKGKNSLLERMVQFVELNPEARGYYRELSRELKTIPPKKVPFLKFALKKRKKSYLEMLKGIQ